jgi:imidazole glycerol phosphate synthase glutamine amidotransferase subunit
VTITLIDYGAGNVTSVARALRRVGATIACTNRPEDVAAAGCLILPGVGHCGALISSLDVHGLREPLLKAISRGTPFLGICLGLQALYESSDEAPGFAGLGLFEGRVELLPQSVKLPHMGWNQLHALRPSRLLDGISIAAYFYFAHSYAVPAGRAETVATCEYGQKFTAVLENESAFGVQFHPEKSGAPGAKLLENFLRLAA